MILSIEHNRHPGMQTRCKETRNKQKMSSHMGKMLLNLKIEFSMWFYLPDKFNFRYMQITQNLSLTGWLPNTCANCHARKGAGDRDPSLTVQPFAL